MSGRGADEQAQATAMLDRQLPSSGHAVVSRVDFRYHDADGWGTQRLIDCPLAFTIVTASNHHQGFDRHSKRCDGGWIKKRLLFYHHRIASIAKGMGDRVPGNPPAAICGAGAEEID
jgi:hypothetical protein